MRTSVRKGRCSCTAACRYALLDVPAVIAAVVVLTTGLHARTLVQRVRARRHAAEYEVGWAVRAPTMPLPPHINRPSLPLARSAPTPRFPARSDAVCTAPRRLRNCLPPSMRGSRVRPRRCCCRALACARLAPRAPHAACPLWFSRMSVRRTDRAQRGQGSHFWCDDAGVHYRTHPPLSFFLAPRSPLVQRAHGLISARSYVS